MEVSNSYELIPQPLKIGGVEISDVTPKVFKSNLKSVSSNKQVVIGMEDVEVTLFDDTMKKKNSTSGKEAKRYDSPMNPHRPFKKIFDKFRISTNLAIFLRKIGIKSSFDILVTCD